MSNKKESKRWKGWVKEIIKTLMFVLVIGWGVDYWRSQSMLSGDVPQTVSESILAQQIDLHAMSQDKPVLVYFWATWCGVCNTVSPSVNLLSDHYQVVSVALRSGKDKTLQQYMNAKEYDFPVLNDARGEIASAWGVAVTPTIFIIDKGKVSSFTTGFTSPIGMWIRLLLA